MKSSLAKKTSITIPAKLEEELRHQAEVEDRSLSGVIQEAVRFYLHMRQWEALQRELCLKARAMGIRNEDDVDRLLHETRP